MQTSLRPSEEHFEPAAPTMEPYSIQIANLMPMVGDNNHYCTWRVDSTAERLMHVRDKRKIKIPESPKTLTNVYVSVFSAVLFAADGLASSLK